MNGYPARTPWRDMSPEQQVAYWRARSRQHERRAVRYLHALRYWGITIPTTDHQEDPR